MDARNNKETKFQLDNTDDIDDFFQTFAHINEPFAHGLLALRGRDEHHNLQVEQIVIGEDDDGEYIEFKGKNCKTYNGGLRHGSIAPKAVKHYVGKADRNIANYYRKYLDAMVKSGPFYRRPVAISNEEPVKFDQVLGVNQLGRLMKTICEKGGLKGNFSNHSGKRTLATRLYQAGVDEQLMMDRTGHRSEKADRMNKRPCDPMLDDVSNV
ncbi:unnamed protein product [Mytilus coruscus]|uniref:DUF3504 domain-containing protein n=1 Tax=Mytilus coruscus TaxID=42192 RepID=A0A6J8CGV2_MYTCO|nr:unnamed protein product [Mytilus coruscus]